MKIKSKDGGGASSKPKKSAKKAAADGPDLVDFGGDAFQPAAPTQAAAAAGGDDDFDFLGGAADTPAQEVDAVC